MTFLCVAEKRRGPGNEDSAIVHFILSALSLLPILPDLQQQPVKHHPCSVARHYIRDLGEDFTYSKIIVVPSSLTVS